MVRVRLDELDDGWRGSVSFQMLLIKLWVKDVFLCLGGTAVWRLGAFHSCCCCR